MYFAYPLKYVCLITFFLYFIYLYSIPNYFLSYFKCTYFSSPGGESVVVCQNCCRGAVEHRLLSHMWRFTVKGRDMPEVQQFPVSCRVAKVQLWSHDVIKTHCLSTFLVFKGPRWHSTNMKLFEWKLLEKFVKNITCAGCQKWLLN